MKKSPINSFISNLIELKSDDNFSPIIQQNAENDSLQLAASGAYKTESRIKVGTMSNDKNSTFIRIFKNVPEEKYELYFLAEDDRFSQYPILFEPISFKYFIIQNDGHAEIPLSSMIDPTQQELSISYPKAFGEFKIENDDHIQDSSEMSLAIQDMRLHITDFISQGTKLLVVFTDSIGNMITRLVPIRNHRATVTLPENIENEFFIGVFD